MDQVRIVGDVVYVATLADSDASAPGWEHATVVALDAARGKALASRALPDPVPIAAMVVEAGVLHVLGTRPGEAVFWYALSLPDLVAVHRRSLRIGDREAQALDVLDAWVSPEGGLWLEIERASGASHSFAYVPPDPEAAAQEFVIDDPSPSPSRDSVRPRDACCEGRALFAPAWRSASSPTLERLESGDAPAHTWGESDVLGESGEVHAVLAQGTITALAFASSAGNRVSAQSLTIDRSTGVVRGKSEVVPLKVDMRGKGTKIARRVNGDLLFQWSSHGGAEPSDLFCACPDGVIGQVNLGGSRPYVVDCVLGEDLLAHRETRDGEVIVGAFHLASDKAWLGRRASSLWSLAAPAMGGDAVLYAGAGHVIVRGVGGLAAIKV